MWGDAILPGCSLLLQARQLESLLAARGLAQRIEAAGWDLVWLFDEDRCSVQGAAEAMLEATTTLRVGAVRPRGIRWSAPGLGWQALRMRGGWRLLGRGREAVLHSDRGVAGASLEPGTTIRDGDKATATTIATLVKEGSCSEGAERCEVVPLHSLEVPTQGARRQRAPRARRLPVDELDDEQRGLYERITSGPRATRTQAFRLVGADGALEGPFGLWLLAPRLGRSFDVLGETMRFGLSLPPRCREVAILAIASWWGSGFEWYAHARIAREIGIDEETVARIRDRDLAGLASDDRFILEFVDALLATWGRVGDALYDRAIQRLGERMMFELVSLVGYYALLAMALACFAVEPPEGAC